MTPDKLITTAVLPAFTDLAALGIPSTRQATRQILAIALQESGLKHRRQVVSGGIENGPAASFWQFEKGGGCRGVLTHKAVADKMNSICAAYNVEATEGGLWEAIRYQDIVAACAARLLLYTLPNKLPENSADGWSQYVAAWRPGKPHPETWDKYWKLADSLV